jgi:putative endonuclease
MFWVYILQCRDGSLYVGSTSDLEARLEVHNLGNGPVFTAKRLPVQLVNSENHPKLAAAVKRERQIKRWSRTKKIALISGDKGQLKALSRCHQMLTH